MSEVIPLRVAVRARPLIPKEKDEGCQQCLTFFPELSQIVLGKDRNFTYDYVFTSDDEQMIVYENCVKPLINHIFKGYNATVLAYGQTGSGKTFTMGGGYEQSLKMDPVGMGVIPRILLDIFEGIKEKLDYEFTVKVSYLEIINEELQDLLLSNRNTSTLAIREENGLIKVTGLLEKQMSGVEETMRVLEQGCSNRTTAATAMNNTSSRSHAIFTVNIEQRHKEDTNDYWKAKLQLVDLAGSERIKKTHAEGERLKEGININKGLLSLGNVISALGDEQQKKSHIPYRDSKLTRILQDSLGGNSHTLMIACVSPADSNMEETLNTLRYADRAKKIKNKPVINWDPQTAEIMRQKDIIQNLKMQLVQAGVSNFSDGPPSSTGNHNLEMEQQKQKLQESIKRLEEQIRELQADNDHLTMSLKKSLDVANASNERAVKLELKCSRLKSRLQDFEHNVGVDFDLLSSSITADNNPVLLEQLDKLKSLASKVNESEDTDELTEEEEEEDENLEDEQEQRESEEAITEEERAIFKEHTRKQAFWNSELQELNKGLLAKERIMTQTQSQLDQFEEIKKKYDATKEELESRVSLLQREKIDLSSALEDAKSNVAATKVSEQRRKRLQELEGQISQLRKQMADAKKVMKLKEMSDKKVQQLNTDIQNMKKARVRLMKQIKEDAEAMRKYKQEKDKQVLQLQQKDRKRQFEIQKLQREKERTQNVLHRKSEEVTAANKRLKEALAMQKKVLDDRTQKFEKFDSNNVGSRIKKVLSNELDIKAGILDAKYHHESLITGRKGLAEEMKQLKEGGDDGPPTKRFGWMDDDGHINDTSIDEEKKKDQINKLQQQLEIQNIQIADLQQRILDAEQETKGKTAKDSIHTMMEAKIAVKWLMEQASSYKAMNTKLMSEVNELKTTNDNMESGKYIETLEADIEELRHNHKAALLKIQEKHNDDIEVIMSTVKATASSDLQQKCEVQEQTIERLTRSQEQLEEKCVQLEKHLTKYMYKDKNVHLMPELTDDETAPEDVKSPFLSPRPKVAVPRRRKTGLFRQPTPEKVDDKIVPEPITETDSSVDNTGGSSVLNTTFEVDSKEENTEDVAPKTEDNAVVGKPPIKLRKQRSRRAVLAAIQTDDSMRSSDEFEKPKKRLTKSSSTGSMKKRSSRSNLTKSTDEETEDQPTRYSMRKRSSASNVQVVMTSPSDDDSHLLEEGVGKKRKLFNVTKKPFFLPPQ